MIRELNDIYSGAGITFFTSSDVSFIDDDNFFDLDQSEETSLAGINDVEGVINIYISSTLTSNGNSLCGYTRFPPSADRVFIAQGCVATEVGTTAHELGHYFTLFHTHGKSNNGTTDELVTRGTGANCTSAGDNICDTPADPNLRFDCASLSGCSYSGSCTDANGEAFTPNTRNIMSYAPNRCRDFFSAGQYDRIRNGLEGGRSYLNIIYDSFTARFTSDARFGCSPSTFEFSDITNNTVSRQWTFEGGSISNSARRVVSVTYDQPGQYDVTLSVTNSAGQESTLTRTNYIIVRDPLENLVQEASLVGFEGNIIPDNFSIENYDRLQSFEISAASSDSEGGSIFVNNFDYNAVITPQFDDLRLTSLDIRDLRGFNFSFDYAYAFRRLN
ncbi:MAG: PKD domain-containing protein, partial [Bacteroidota bacterium]